MGRQIGAVLFDLDGVLVDTRRLHYEALSSALNDLNLNMSLEEHTEKYDGLPTYRKIQMLALKHNLTQEQIEFLNDRKQAHTVKFLNGFIQPKPEHIKIFEFLKAQNIKTAICSNTKRSTLDFIIENLKIKSYLEFSLSNEDIAEPKPSPEIYLLAMQKLNVVPHETFIFEDSPHGLEAARLSNANVECINQVDEMTLERLLQSVS